MHRAATRALRTTYRCTARTLTRSSRRGLLLPQQPSAAVAYGARQYHRNPARSPQHAGHAIEPLQSSIHDAVARSFATTTATTTSDAAAPTRTVLVIGADELHTGTYVGEGPISKTTGNDGKRVVEMITPDQATEKLRKTEQSYFVNRGQGVLRYDLVQLPSNDPIEDDHAEKIVEVPGRNGASDVPNSDWMFWGVFDGHSGWTTSAKLRQTLINTVANELNDTYKAAPGHSPAAEAVEAAIKAGFTKLDDEIVHQSVEKASGSSSNSQFDSTWARIFGSGNKPQLPVEHAKGQDVGGQKTPIRLQQWGISPDAPERFVVKDKNVATHLVRNALGGKNEEQVTALLTLPAPFSRRYRYVIPGPVECLP
ncbi:hypothetical protein VdG1_00851 [Verticillium dahliae VDG1]|nr:hypothetical protein VdG1_00851 [Verticillium dahliae VDG1]